MRPLPSCARALVLLAGLASLLRAQGPLSGPDTLRCRDGDQYVRRFVSVDSSTFAGDPRVLRRFRERQARTDTVLLWRTPRSIWSWRWTLLLTPRMGDTVRVDQQKVNWRQATPDSGVLARFAPVRASMPCMSEAWLGMIHPPPLPHSVSYQDILVATIEPTTVTLPYLTWGFPKEMHQDLETGAPSKALGLMYEGTIAPAFLAGFLDRPWTIAVTPRVVVRQLSGGSAPVPPPSYMPRVAVYYWGGRFQRRHDAHPRSFPYAWLMFSHHSNGQEGHPVDTLTGRPNYQTGNFSRNFLELGLGTTTSDPEEGLETARLSVEVHPDSWADAYQRDYGSVRPRLTIETIEPLERVGSDGYIRLALDAAAMLGPMAPAYQGWGNWRKRLNWSVTGTVKPTVLTTFAFFVNFYNGQDYYNMYYDRRLRVLRLGAVANALAFRFEVPPIR